MTWLECAALFFFLVLPTIVVARRVDAEGALYGLLAAILIPAPIALFLLLDGALTAGERQILVLMIALTSILTLFPQMTSDASLSERSVASSTGAPVEGWPVSSQPRMVVTSRVVGSVTILWPSPSALAFADLRPILYRQLDELLSSAAGSVVADIRQLRRVRLSDVLAMVRHMERLALERSKHLVVCGEDYELQLLLRLNCVQPMEFFPSLSATVRHLLRFDKYHPAPEGTIRMHPSA